MTVKRCGNCSHSMAIGMAFDQVFCIESSPSIMPDGSTRFPCMMVWGKCDKFIEGQTQPESKSDPVRFVPRGNKGKVTRRKAK